MPTMPNKFYKKKYYFNVIYEVYMIYPKIIESRQAQYSVYENHSKFAYAKCATNIFKNIHYVKEIVSIELLHSELNNKG